MKEEKTEKNRISGISESNSGKDQKVRIDLKNGLKEKLPDNFNVDDIGNIDLREAEKIANEDILFLTENDLILGLEEFDLIPLKDDSSPSPDEPVTQKKGMKRTSVPVSPSDSHTEDDTSVTAEEREQAIIDTILSEGEGEKVPAEVIAEEESAAGQDTLPEDLKRIEPREEQEENEEKAAVSDEIVDDIDLGEIVEFSEPDFASLSEDDFLEKPVPEEKKDEEPVSPEKVEEVSVVDAGSVKEYTLDEIREIGTDDSRVRFIDDESFEKEEVPVSEFGESELENIAVEIGDVIEKKSIILTEADDDEDRKMIASFISDDRNAYSDLIIDFEDAEYKYRDTELDIIDSSIIDEDYSDYIKKIDDYYGSTGEVEREKAKTSVELFGLSDYEMNGIEDHLFHDEYKGINIEAEVDLFRVDFGPIDLSETREKNYRYITPRQEELDETVKLSIEEDLSSDNALIFEEDIDEIEKLLGREVHDPKKPAAKDGDKAEPEEAREIIEPSLESDALDDTHLGPEDLNDEIVFSDSDLEIIVEDFFDEMALKSSATEDDGSPAESEHEEIYDITDKIVILEDDIDIDRFIKKFPEEKQDNLKNLLKYLDGLFEKLPESTIKSFADSEYFDLYAKVLNDMGIS